MIKQITVENLYNFRNEVTVDFTVNKNQGLYHSYNKENISNLSLMYGKNNVGKSNFFKILKQSIDFIFNNNMNLVPYRPSGISRNSLFEIIVENPTNEIRYGFEINIDSARIVDEWMYSKRDGSSRETEIFGRKDLKFNNIFGAADKKVLEQVKDTVLYLNHLSSLSNQNSLISEILNALKGVKFVSCLSGGDQHELTPGILALHQNKAYREVLKTFLRSADLDIIDIETTELTDEEQAVIDEISNIFLSNESQSVKSEKSKALFESKAELFPLLFSKNLVGKINNEGGTGSVSYEYVHRNGARFFDSDLSTGTRQIISIVLMLIDAIGTDSVLIFDEIEAGLHIELIDLIMNLFKTLILDSPQLQIIITTHQESLLDYEFIPRESKIFLKLSKETAEIEVDYLSDYTLREYEVPSKRYKLNAFGTNPNTSSEYELNEAISKFKESDN